MTAVIVSGNERGDGSSVIGVEYPPGLEVGDDAFDGGADGVDLGVEFFVAVMKFTSG